MDYFWSIISHRTHPRHFFGTLGWDWGGGTKRRGEGAVRILPVALWQKKKGGNIFWQPLRGSLLLFLVNFSRLVDRHVVCERDRRDALSRGGRIQWWCERTQLNLGILSDGKKLFCGGTEQQIFPSPNKGAQRGRNCILHVSVVGTRRSKSKG